MTSPGVTLRSAARRHLGWLPVGVVCLWNVWNLRAEATPVAYLDDSSMHEQMVRAAGAALRGGHLPLTQWFPDLSLGSPHFLHYQSGGATVTGAVGLVVGADTAFRWSLLLLVGLWPLAVYASARIWGFEPAVAAVAGVVSPFLSSVPGIGYEQKAYLWIGYGVWAQLWASWALPFAWATTWRAMSDRRWALPAVVAIGATTALHFETGYLAFGAVLVLPFVADGPARRRLGTAVLVLVGALGATAWVTVPVITQGSWAAVNQALSQTGLVRGYGARQDLVWLVTGRTFDAGRFPVVTIAVLAGVVAACSSWRRHRRDLAVVCLFAGALLLSFGPTTWGALADVVPGHQDLFFRRFLVGVHLAGIYLAGIGVVAVWRRVRPALGRTSGRIPHVGSGRRELVTVVVCVLVGAVAVAPAVVQLTRFDRADAAAIGRQHRSEAGSGSLTRLLDRVRADPVGRVYAGAPGNWGDDLRIGQVPVYKYLESQDVDEVGYTLRTAALMTGPEYHFDWRVPGDYAVFGVHYLVLAAGSPPPVPARLVAVSGRFALWTLPGSGYASVVDVVGTLATDRARVGTDTAPFLASASPGAHRSLEVVRWGAVAPTPRVPVCPVSACPGTAGVVTSEVAALDHGTADVRVVLRRPAVVELAASFDPGWRATVDGRPAPTVMLAPAVVGVAVGSGAHVVHFGYHGFGSYPLLFAVGAASVVAVLLAALTARRPEEDPTRVTPGG